MHELVQKTIDKVSFKINIWILMTIISSAFIVGGWYVKLTTDVATVQLWIAQILDKLSNNDTAHQVLNDKITVLDKRITILETKADIK